MPKRYIPALIIVVALIGLTIYFYQQESTYIKGMEITTGVVAGLGNKSTSTTTINGKMTTVNTQALVDFQFNGSTYRVNGRAMGYPDWKIGQPVDVYFSPKDPGKSRIKRWDELYFFTFVSAFFLIACVFFGIINFIVYKVRGKPLS
jgi:hypothetical protein